MFIEFHTVKNTFFSKGDILHRFVTINSGCKKLTH